MLNRGAMFVLDARIKKTCHPELDSGSHFYSLKKAAMFGLDARIALAIFGALSVISGASLYSAIQDAKVASFITSMNEINKAVEEYVLDTGVDIFGVSSVFLVNLIENDANVYNWNGPYINADNHANHYPITMNGLGSGSVYGAKATNTDWDNPASFQCDGSLPCYIWIESFCYSAEFAKKVSIKLDGADTPDSGLVRYEDSCTWITDSNDTYKIRIRGMLTLNQKVV